MQLKPLKRMGGAIAIAFVALMLIGCRGATGQNGANGTNGTNGNNGGNGTNGTSGGVGINAAAYTPDAWAKLTLKGSITGVSLTAGTPVVNFKVTDGNGTPIYGLTNFTAKNNTTALYASYPNFAFTIAKLVPGTNGSPSRWVNYIVTSTPTVAAPTATPSKPSTDNVGTMTETKDGNYTYTFLRNITTVQTILDAYTYTGNNVKTDLDDISYQPDLTHRVAIQLGGAARGTGTNTPNASASSTASTNILNATNLIYDFIPATGQPVSATDEQRNIVAISNCNTCHSKLAPHGGSRVDTKYCVICHTDQRKYGTAEATPTATGYSGTTSKINGLAAGNFPAFIHRMHMGEGLTKTGYNYGGILFNDVTYPQDKRNCVKCHNTTNTTAPVTGAQGDNWFAKPNRMACGACHDVINFATGAGHGNGGPQLTDQNCSQCHDAAGIKVDHLPVVPPDPTNGGLSPANGGSSANTHTNASWIDANQDNLPAGGKKVAWNLKSVSVTAGKPSWVFNILIDGTPAVFNTYSSTGKLEMIDGFVGGPNLYLAYAVPQDGITTPNDYNGSINVNLRKLWRGAAATGSTITYDTATKLYTVTLGGVTVPPSASMITGGIGYAYGVVAWSSTGYPTTTTDSLPLTQISGITGPVWNPTPYPYDPATYQGGLSVAAPNVWTLAAGQTPRRTIVNSGKCNSCHGNLGVFTDAVFHAGQRNDAATCTFCHNVNGVNSGWSINIKEAVHSLHASGKRTTPYTWQSQLNYWNVTYPAILNDCEACHVSGSYDFSASANASAVPKLLWTTFASGTINAAGQVLTDPATYDSTKTYISPFVTAGTNYGQGLQVNTTTATKAATTWGGVIVPLAAGATLQPEPTTLVNSPIASACYACHDSAIARDHIVINGGSLNVLRSTVTTAVAGITTVPIVSNESCLVCHGSGKLADIKAVHMNFK